MLDVTLPAGACSAEWDTEIQVIIAGPFDGEHPIPLGRRTRQPSEHRRTRACKRRQKMDITGDPPAQKRADAEHPDSRTCSPPEAHFGSRAAEGERTRTLNEAHEPVALRKTEKEIAEARRDDPVKSARRGPSLRRGQHRDDVLVQRDAFALGGLDELLMERDGHADVRLTRRSRAPRLGRSSSASRCHGRHPSRVFGSRHRTQHIRRHMR
jgi:hypothetical protein